MYVVLIWVLVQYKWCNIHSIKHSQYGIEWCSLCIDFFICISYNVCKYLSSSKFIIYLLIERMAHFFPNISLLLEYTLFHVKYQWKLAKWIIHLKCRYEWIPKYLIGYEWNMYKSVLWGDSAYIQVIMDLTKNYVLLLGIYREKVINLMVFYERTKRVTTI